MTDFKTNIKQKYAEQVQPTIPADGWEKFEQFRNNKRKRRRRFLWFLLPIGLLLGSSPFWLFPERLENTTFNQIESHSAEQVMTNIRDEDFANSSKVNSEALEEKSHTSTKSQISIPESQASIKVHSSSNKRTNNVKSINSHSNNTNSKENHSALNETIKNKSNIVTTIKTSPDSDLPFKDHQVITKASSDKPNFPEASSDKENYIYQRSINECLLLKPKQLSILSPHRIMLTKYILRLPNSRINTHPPAAVFFVGAGFPNSIQTLEETAFLFGLSYSYPIWRNLFIRSDLSFHNINYQAKVMNPNLGLRTVQAPKPGQAFTKAEVESNSLQFGLGFDYAIFRNKNWTFTTSATYLLAKELIKDSDYFFEGPVPNDTSDDDLITLRNKDNYFISNLIRPELGLSYQLPGASIKLGLSYSYQLNKNSYPLVDQFQLNLGLRRRF